MRFVGEHPFLGAAGAFVFLAANLFDFGAARSDKSFLAFLKFVGQQPAGDETIESLLACGLAFHLQSGRAMQQHDAGGGLVDILAAVPAGADKRFFNVGFMQSHFGHAPRELGFLFRADGKCAHPQLMVDCRKVRVNDSCVSLLEYILLAASSLFVIVDPLATTPAFLAMTPNDTPEQRLRTARVACCTTAVVLLLFSVAGTFFFRIFGITMPAFQIAASIVLLLIALDMLRVQRSRVQETHEEKQAGAEKPDIAVTPLAIPMLAGPGAISTTILLQNEAKTVAQHFALYGCIVAVALATYLIFRLAVRGARWLNPIAMSIAIRIMGLLLAAVAVQFMLDALKEFHAEWLAS